MKYTLLILVLAGATLTAQEDYSGPAILSRGGMASSLSRNPDVSFRPYVGLLGTYDTGFTGVTLDSSGHLQNAGTFGIMGNVGLYGTHSFRHTSIGLDYRGSLQHYPGHSFYDGTDQALTLSIDHQFSKRLSVSFYEVGGTYSRNYGFASAGGLLDPQLLILPTEELYVNRVIYDVTGASLVYRFSPRLSVSLGASGFLAKRRSKALFGVTGYSAQADLGYRMTRFLTVGTWYNFDHFGFTKGIGSSDIHSAGGFLSWRLSRALELSVSAGAGRVETLFLASVPLDPAVAAITGQSAAIFATYRVQYIPTGRVRLTRTSRYTMLTLNYGREISPGNGVYLTSRMDSAGVMFSYTGLRHWNLGLNASYDQSSGLAQTIGRYEGYSAGAGLTRDLGHGLQFVVRLDERYYLTHFANFSRHAAVASLGFMWSPGEIPLSLW